jgi:hypothetical protein
LDLAGHRGLSGVGRALAVLVGGSEVRHDNIWFGGCGVGVVVKELLDAGRESMS